MTTSQYGEASLQQIPASRSGEAILPHDQLRRLVTVEVALLLSVSWLAFVLRIWGVGTRAMHLDESTVAWFGWQLATGHGYAYDPVYHGPFQHEVLASLFMLFQASEVTARLPAVALGTGLVILPWFLRDYIGRFAALISCVLIAVSPSFLYFARFERDDTYMEFFTLLTAVLVLRFWRDRRPWQLYGGVMALAMAFATKESIYIVMFIFGSFLLLAWLRDISQNACAIPEIPHDTRRRSVSSPSTYSWGSYGGVNWSDTAGQEHHGF